jgi:hypothetical protein
MNKGPLNSSSTGGFDHLYIAPEVADTVASVAVPAPARPSLQVHLQGFTSWICNAFAEPVQHAAVYIFDIRLYRDALCRVQDQVVKRHAASLT